MVEFSIRRSPSAPTLHSPSFLRPTCSFHISDPTSLYLSFPVELCLLFDFDIWLLQWQRFSRIYFFFVLFFLFTFSSKIAKDEREFLRYEYVTSWPVSVLIITYAWSIHRNCTSDKHRTMVSSRKMWCTLRVVCTVNLQRKIIIVFLIYLTYYKTMNVPDGYPRICTCLKTSTCNKLDFICFEKCVFIIQKVVSFVSS